MNVHYRFPGLKFRAFYSDQSQSSIWTQPLAKVHFLLIRLHISLPWLSSFQIFSLNFYRSDIFLVSRIFQFFVIFYDFLVIFTVYKDL